MFDNYRLFRKNTWFILFFFFLIFLFLCFYIFSKNDERNNISRDNIKVAVLDSGIDKKNYYLKDRVVKEFNSIDRKNIKDVFWHGTPIAAIITSKNNDVSISQNVDLYSIKVMKDDGKISREAFINGFEWAISEDVDIINLSFGFHKNFSDLNRLVEKALNKGIIIVAASGNNYGLNSQFPARYDNVISVGSFEKIGKVSNFSSMGKVDFFAPGVDVLSISDKEGNSFYTGTSYSTPYVTGVIANFLFDSDIKKDYDIHSKVFSYLEKKSIKKNDNTLFFLIDK